MSLCSCTTGGVPPAEVHLRAGHSLGNSHGRYIFGSAGHVLLLLLGGLWILGNCELIVRRCRVYDIEISGW